MSNKKGKKVTDVNSEVKYMDDYRNIMANYDISKYVSNKYITRYEKSEIMGQRTTQIANGAIPMIKLDPERNYTVREIVEEEYKQGVIPFIIERSYGNDKSTVEYWKFSDLIRF